MDIENLAKEMRDRALLLSANPNLSEHNLKTKRLEYEKSQQIKRVEDLKKLYFNAGRWAGGARDYIAREAFYKVNQQ